MLITQSFTAATPLRIPWVSLVQFSGLKISRESCGLPLFTMVIKDGSREWQFSSVTVVYLQKSSESTSPCQVRLPEGIPDPARGKSQEIATLIAKIGSRKLPCCCTGTLTLLVSQFRMVRVNLGPQNITWLMADHHFLHEIGHQLQEYHGISRILRSIQSIPG